MFNLLPQEDVNGKAIATIYFHKCICELCSNGIYSEYNRLYNDVRASEVFDYYAVKRAVNYE